MWKLGCLVIPLILIAIAAIAAHYLPWWGVVIVVMGEIFIVRQAVPRLIAFAIGRFAKGMFVAKSSVLRDASARIHRVESTNSAADDTEAAAGNAVPMLIEPADAERAVPIISSPSGAEDDEDNTEADPDVTSYARHVLVEFTLTPHQPAAGGMQHYEPGDLSLVPFEAAIAMDAEDDDLESQTARLASLALIADDGSIIDDIGKLTGPARLRAVFAIPPALNGRVKFRYYFESFGDLLLP